MGIFENMASTPASKGRGSFLPGGFDGLLEIRSCRVSQSRKVRGTCFFICDMEVLTSNIEGFDPGRLATWMGKIQGGDFPEMALADVKALVMAATGAEEDDVDEELMDEIVGPKKDKKGNDIPGTAGAFLDGEKVRIVVETIKTKAGRDFSKHSFYRPDEGPEEEDETAAG